MEVSVGGEGGAGDAKVEGGGGTGFMRHDRHPPETVLRTPVSISLDNLCCCCLSASNYKGNKFGSYNFFPLILLF